MGRRPTRDSFTIFIARSPSRRRIWRPIEAKMAEVIARDEQFMREFAPREKALEEFERDGDFMKTHFVTKFTEPGDEVSFYRNGKFVDFCRGPHVPSTGRVKAVKVTKLAGAYWLGDEKNPQLQRDLRDGVLLAKGDGRALCAAGRSGQARPSPAGQAAGPVQHSGACRRGSDLLASQGRASSAR